MPLYASADAPGRTIGRIRSFNSSKVPRRSGVPSAARSSSTIHRIDVVILFVFGTKQNHSINIFQGLPVVR